MVVGNELKVCSLCYHPNEESIILLCRHAVCISCIDKLSGIAPPQLAGKVFCPICSQFMGRQVVMVTRETQTLIMQDSPLRKRTSSSSTSDQSCQSDADSGYEDSVLQQSFMTSTPTVTSLKGKREDCKASYLHSKANKTLLADFYHSSATSVNAQSAGTPCSGFMQSTEGPSKIEEEFSIQLTDDLDTNACTDTPLSHTPIPNIGCCDKNSYIHYAMSADTDLSLITHHSDQSHSKTPNEDMHCNVHQNQNNNTADKQRCSEHAHCKAKFSCTDCQKIICPACKVGAHKGHSMTPLNHMQKADIVNKMRESEQHVEDDSAFSETTGDHVIGLKAWIEDLTTYIQILKKKKKYAMKQLTVRRDFLQHFVERWFGKMSLQIDTLFDEEIIGIQKTVEDITNNIEQYENSYSSLCTSDIALKPVPPMSLSSIKEHLAVVLSFGVGLTYNMLGTISATYLQQEIEELPTCPVSNFEDSISLASLRDSESYDHTSSRSSSSSSIALPPLLYLPKPHVYILGHGKELRSFESRSSEDVLSPYMATGLSLLHNGHVMVTDIGQDSVKVFSTAGRFLFDVNTLPEDQATKAIQTNNGEIAVATKSCIKLYTSEGRFLSKTADGVECPQGMTSAPNGNILISDNINDIPVIVTYRPDLQTPVHVFSSLSQKDPSQRFTQPWYIATNSQNDIFVSDRTEHCIKVYSRRGHFKWSAGGQGAAPGQLFHPAGITSDKYGNVLVADCGNCRIQVFSASGEWLGIVVDAQENELQSPMDIAINNSGHLLVLQADGNVRTFRYLV